MAAGQPENPQLGETSADDESDMGLYSGDSIESAENLGDDTSSATSSPSQSAPGADGHATSLTDGQLKALQIGSRPGRQLPAIRARPSLIPVRINVVKSSESKSTSPKSPDKSPSFRALSPLVSPSISKSGTPNSSSAKGKTSAPTSPPRVPNFGHRTQKVQQAPNRSSSDSKSPSISARPKWADQQKRRSTSVHSCSSLSPPRSLFDKGEEPMRGRARPVLSDDKVSEFDIREQTRHVGVQDHVSNPDEQSPSDLSSPPSLDHGTDTSIESSPTASLPSNASSHTLSLSPTEHSSYQGSPVSQTGHEREPDVSAGAETTGTIQDAGQSASEIRPETNGPPQATQLESHTEETVTSPDGTSSTLGDPQDLESTPRSSPVSHTDRDRAPKTPSPVSLINHEFLPQFFPEASVSTSSAPTKPISPQPAQDSESLTPNTSPTDSTISPHRTSPVQGQPIPEISSATEQPIIVPHLESLSAITTPPPTTTPSTPSTTVTTKTHPCPRLPPLDFHPLHTLPARAWLNLETLLLRTSADYYLLAGFILILAFKIIQLFLKHEPGAWQYFNTRAENGGDWGLCKALFRWEWQGLNVVAARFDWDGVEHC